MGSVLGRSGLLFASLLLASGCRDPVLIYIGFEDASSGHDAGDLLDAGNLFDADTGSAPDASGDAGNSLDADAGSTLDASDDAGDATPGDPSPAPGTGNLVITEAALAFAGSPENEFEWIEITNPSSTETYELMGCIVVDSSAMPHTIGTSLEIAPGESLVLGGPMADAPRDYTFPSTIFEIADNDELSLHCGDPMVIVDSVNFGGAGFPTSVDGTSWQLNPDTTTAADNDTGANWCRAPMSASYGTMGFRGSPAAGNPACVACEPPLHLVINEVDYDQAGGSDGEEFIELINPTASPIDLSNMAVVLINGVTSAEYLRVSLSGMLAGGTYAVVARAGFSVPGGVSLFTFAGSSDQMQNGAPDGVALIHTTGPTVIDYLSYEGAQVSDITLTGGAMLSVPEGASTPGAADSSTVTGSMIRTPNARDRDTPAMDWAFTTTATPGAVNVP